MRQLSGSDNMFLWSEQKNVYNHIANLAIYDVSTAPDGQVRFKDILKHYEDRIYLHPIFRHRLVTPPFGIDRPYWVAEEDIDVEFHIRHIALPKPGDWRQLMIQVARLHSRPLDRTRPLWEIYVIEGLDNIANLPAGAFALFTKLHHASLDGMASLHLWEQMHSASSAIAASADRQLVVADSTPNTLEFISRAVANTASRAVEAVKLSGRLTSKVAELGKEQVGELLKGRKERGSAIKPSTGKAPATRFDKDLTAHRVFDGFGIPLSRIKRVRSKVPGATLNDLFLAVSGGAVRKYLLSKGELPEASLVISMPISLRTDASEGGNRVGVAMVRARSDIEDPLERLRTVHLEAQAGKQQAEKMGPALMTDLSESLPATVGMLLARKLYLPMVNMTVSNVRGPDKSMYVAGAKAMCMYPVSVPFDGIGLNITGVSYNGVMWVSAVSCRDMMPDPGFFKDCMKEAWEEILTAADALPEQSAAQASPRKKPTSASKASAKKTPVAAKPVTKAASSARKRAPAAKKPGPVRPGKTPV